MNYYFLIVFFLAVGCESYKHPDRIEISLEEIDKPLKVVLRDSIYYQIVFDTSGRISSILPYRAGILEGHGYEFFSNGGLKKKMELKSGRLDGLAQYFYESGNLWKQILLKRDELEFSKLEYWDSMVPVVMHAFEVDSTGTITKIKIFNQKGNFIKDSTTSGVEKLYPE